MDASGWGEDGAESEALLLNAQSTKAPACAANLTDL
jgi:hypothetical protein